MDVAGGGGGGFEGDVAPPLLNLETVNNCVAMYSLKFQPQNYIIIADYMISHQL